MVFKYSSLLKDIDLNDVVTLVNIYGKTPLKTVALVLNTTTCLKYEDVVFPFGNKNKEELTNDEIAVQWQCRNLLCEVLEERSFRQLFKQNDLDCELLSHDISSIDLIWLKINLALVEKSDFPNELYDRLKNPNQINRYPGMPQALNSKHLLAKNIKEMAERFGEEEFSFHPITFTLPEDYYSLQQFAEQNPKVNFISKPKFGGRGIGIHLYSNVNQIENDPNYVIQKYIPNPFLIDGKKFTLRLYVLVTSLDPLIIYIHNHGSLKFATIDFTNDKSTFNDLNMSMHITNQALNTDLSSYTFSTDVNVDDVGSKWSLKAFWRYLDNNNLYPSTLLWKNIKDVVVKTIFSAEPSVLEKTKELMKSDSVGFQLMGLDIDLLDNFQPIFIEANMNAQLGFAKSPFDNFNKLEFIRETFDMIGHTIYNSTTIKEDIKSKLLEQKSELFVDQSMNNYHIDEQSLDKLVQFEFEIYYSNQLFRILNNCDEAVKKLVIVGLQKNEDDSDNTCILAMYPLDYDTLLNNPTLLNIVIPGCGSSLYLVGTLFITDSDNENEKWNDRDSQLSKLIKSTTTTTTTTPTTTTSINSNQFIHLNIDNNKKSIVVVDSGDNNNVKLESKSVGWLAEQIKSSYTLARVTDQVSCENVNSIDESNISLLNKPSRSILSNNQSKSAAEQWDKLLNQSSLSNNKSSNNSSTTVDFQLLIKQSSNNNKDITELFAPTLRISNTSSSLPLTLATHTIDINTLTYLPKKQPINASQLFTQIVQAIKLQISQSSTVNHKVYHFQFNHLIPFPISVSYELNKYGEVNDDQQRDKRMMYHRLLCLPLNRPMIRSTSTTMMDTQSSSCVVGVDNKQWTSHIKDIHKHLDCNSKFGGKVSLVQGSYDYYHYKQDNMNDDGWGCAYRSMQTICSWLKYQELTMRSVPSHWEIQKTLVDMDDKKASFYKSSQWIGAIEISLCLQNLYNVNGSDVILKTRELARHFERDGSPIMIGGGVLAYTLLGVDFNSETGESRYLILDPHYTGDPENIKLIKEKGWCGWKGPELFRKDAFYNFCLPQLSTEI
ncbi:hypothetical protein PPL_09303 [Heterostelium album PN500]|uniref:UFSP1/2/DUB catalytic domain-containing protein n=1 Tax=Heterostelium pallidum (strain ATCC 26659 / Pp 5 / PN500) TaxID=670386 RepID=D3BL71_HETP5|nr:hypothetical protein PPL_09303 [Heterostelium album PN500]EFA77805.1 hypothetical protein PPL_09303 [Heterostelium album PN500]|eukprot:XP_020429933.1 hypothetical protein PPL_09303 [Heterostelium album PN500]